MGQVQRRSPQVGAPFDRLPPDLCQTRILLDERLIAGAGHEIHLFEPSAVVQAVQDVVESARAKTPLPRR